MLWRRTYEPRVAEGVALPDSTISTSILLGAFDARGQAELGIWLRLLESASLDRHVSLAFIRPAWTPKDRRLVEAIIPPSRRTQIAWVEDPEGKWAAVIQPDRPERCFAALLSDGVADMLIVGPPTEDVWERFSEVALKRVTA